MSDQTTDPVDEALQTLINHHGGNVGYGRWKKECKAAINAEIARQVAEELIKELEALQSFQEGVPVPWEVGVGPYIEGRLVKLKESKGEL